MKIGEYPLCSMQSRAAARQTLTGRKAVEFEGILVRFVSAVPPSEPDRICTCPLPRDGMIAFCRCFL